ncbi:hypothetical protein FJK98_01310 [Micromonospora sp. HM134]|uniref:hypothetical protein n=1 Tax=Micromonospora sp. HM134 TaxID=2583243 RepID=UPI001198AFF0|nr:hypothetical protein [Micromonospora sp. HM134]QDY05960.1 hypothetical protein FJK98_01310 [Micromonospora sp. HM134]
METVNTGRRQTALLVVALVLPALLAFGVVRLLGARDGAGHRAASPPPSGPASPSDAVGVGPVLDVTARITGTEDGTELTFLTTRARAEAGPPAPVTDCRQFAGWAQRDGGIPVGVAPVHALSVHARRTLDIGGVSVAAVSVTDVDLSGGDGPWVELACRDDAPAPATTPSGSGRPAGRWEGDPGRPRVLVAGQTIELPAPLGPPYDGGEVFPHGTVDYQLRVRMEIDGVVEEHRLRNGDVPFRCCARVTHMGFQAARYEWRVSPARSLRYCAELRWTGQPPPPKCELRRG